VKNVMRRNRSLWRYLRLAKAYLSQRFST
jgi:hypothetical protein